MTRSVFRSSPTSTSAARQTAPRNTCSISSRSCPFISRLTGSSFPGPFCPWSTSLGSGKWQIGPFGAAILTGKWWQLGAQIYNLWSYAGDASRPAVNTMFLQPVLNIFLPQDWYFTFGPQVTANWKASSGNTWTVPVGGGIGRAFTIAGQGGTAQVEAYNYVERPAGSATWTVILTVQFVFSQ